MRATKPLFAWTNTATRAAWGGRSVSSGVGGDTPLVAADGRWAATTSTPTSPSAVFFSIPVLEPRLLVPPNRPYHRASVARLRTTRSWVAWTSTPSRPSTRVGVAAVPSSRAVVVERTVLVASAPAPPAKPPAVAPAFASASSWATWALTATLRARRSAPLPTRAFVWLVRLLADLASDAPMNPAPSAKVRAFDRISVSAPIRRAPPASTRTPAAVTWGAAASPVTAPMSPTAVPTNAAFVVV